jgi:hypothetical protein
LIEVVASGIPRLDYPLGGGCPALLVEPSGTNLALHSRDLTNAVWSGTNVTTAKNAVGADGVASEATTITATAASGTVLQALSHASQSRVFSAYIRRVTGTGAIQLTTNGGTNWTTVTISSLYTQVACAAQTVASGTIGIRLAVSGDVIEVDFTQGEVGPVATSPIATTTTSATRNADVITLSGAVSGCIGQTEGTIYAEVDLRALSVARSIFSISLNSNTTDFAALQINSSNRLLARIRSNTGTVQDVTASSTVTGTTKIAMAYDSSGSVLVVNGTIIGTNASGITSWSSGVNFVHIGNGPNAASGSSQAAFFNDRIRAAALYTTRLTDAQLQALTT